MKITGQEISRYDDETLADEMPKFITLGEAVIEAGPKGLRKLAKFLVYCAKQMEKGSEQDHYHHNQSIHDRPQIVVVSKKIMKQHEKDAITVAEYDRALLEHRRDMEKTT